MSGATKAAACTGRVEACGVLHTRARVVSVARARRRCVGVFLLLFAKMESRNKVLKAAGQAGRQVGAGGGLGLARRPGSGVAILRYTC